MGNNTILPGVGDVVEDIQIADGSKRQVVTIGDRAGTSGDLIGRLDETAPVTDIAASGLNGRLQRIAQRLTTILGSVIQTSVGDGQNITFGARTDNKSALTDASSISFMSVAKNISYCLQAIIAGPLTVALDTSRLINSSNSTVQVPKFATIVASSSGATTIVAAVTGKRIRVLSLRLTAAAAVNAKWQSHTAPTDITGLNYYAAAGGGEVLPFNPVGWFQTIAGDALDINLSNAIAVGGHLTYVEV